MHKTVRLLDTLGVALLGAAAAALVGALWFADVMSAVLLGAFARCLLAGVGTLLLARVLQISAVFAVEGFSNYRRIEAPVRAPVLTLADSRARRTAQAGADRFDTAA